MHAQATMEQYLIGKVIDVNNARGFLRLAQWSNLPRLATYALV